MPRCVSLLGGLQVMNVTVAWCSLRSSSYKIRQLIEWMDVRMLSQDKVWQTEERLSFEGTFPSLHMVALP